MRFRMSIMIVAVIIGCMKWTGCTWVTSGSSLFLVSDGEAKMLADVFGDEVMDHIDNGRLTKDEHHALEAYWAGTGYLLEEYPSYSLKMESFKLLPDGTYEIEFTCGGIPFTCNGCPVADGYECFDDFEPDK